MKKMRLAEPLVVSDSDNDDSLRSDDDNNLQDFFDVLHATPSTSVKPPGDPKLVSHVAEMIPDICPDYVRRLCAGKPMTDSVLEDILQETFAGELLGL